MSIELGGEENAKKQIYLFIVILFLNFIYFEVMAASLQWETTYGG